LTEMISGRKHLGR